MNSKICDALGNLWMTDLILYLSASKKQYDSLRQCNPLRRALDSQRYKEKPENIAVVAEQIRRAQYLLETRGPEQERVIAAVGQHVRECPLHLSVYKTTLYYIITECIGKEDIFGVIKSESTKPK